MVKSLASIKAPIAEELKVFEKHFKESMRSKVALLDKITYYIVQRKGKQMRPMFVFLSAKICGGTTDSSYNAASFIELLHTGTLVHDDVVDDSMERRGVFTINALWKNKIAVLVGDFLFSRGMLLALEKGEHRLLEIFSVAIKAMSEGELLQMEKARRLDIKESIYFDIIRQKTASLIAAACSSGAASAGASEEIIEKMRLFGEKIGMAFQIKDDLFDFGNDDVGKPLGIDIKEKKMTLPVIYALNNTSRMQRRKMINNIKKSDNDPQRVKEVIDFVKASGGIEYAQKIMLEYRSSAFEILESFPESPARSSMKELVIFSTERKK